jgi:hypothetical protein
MKRIVFLLMALGTIASLVAFTSPTCQTAVAQDAAPVYGVTIPAAYNLPNL